MSRRYRALLAITTALAIEIVLVLNLIDSVADQPQEWIWVVGLAGFPVAAALVFVFRPENRAGWALDVAALTAGMIFVQTWYGVRHPDAPFAAQVEALERLPAVGQMGGMIAIIHLFPDGRCVGRWHRRFFLGLVALLALASVLWLLSPQELTVSHRANPFGVLPHAVGVLGDRGVVLLLPFALVGVVSMVVRWRRAAAVERAQLKWFVIGGVFAVGWLTLVQFVPDGDPRSPSEIIGGLIVITAFWSVPAAVVIAILRYRLYDIDLLIKRTIVYGSLTALTVGTYLLLVLALGALVNLFAGDRSNGFIIAATTLIVAALFQPARRRVQAFVDRCFYRARYDAERTLEAFQTSLRDQTDLDALRSQLAATVQEALRPATVSVWLRPGSAE